MPRVKVMFITDEPAWKLSHDELEGVSAGADINTMLQTLSSCLRQMSEMQKSVIRNMRA